METHDRLLSVAEAAKSLTLKPVTVRAWVAARKIASVRIGRVIRIPAAAVRDVLDRGYRPAMGDDDTDRR
jgi:excisionase family DNA binding protein